MFNRSSLELCQRDYLIGWSGHDGSGFGSVAAFHGTIAGSFQQGS
jgi:hypothetical protein